MTNPLPATVDEIGKVVPIPDSVLKELQFLQQTVKSSLLLSCAMELDPKLARALIFKDDD